MSNKEGLNIEGKEAKKFSDLTIFTSTFYGADATSQVRQKLAEKFLSNCKELGINCVVVDGGSNQEFIDKIKSFQNVSLLYEPSVSMGESRQDALRVAMEKYKTPYFLWAEPEKDDLITEKSLLVMIKGLREKKADVVVPQRAGYDTLPKLQAWIEKRANKRATRVMDPALDESFDLWFGPKMFNQAGAKYFVDYKSVLNKWDTVTGPVIDAYKDGLKVSSVTVNYKYHISQRKDEESNEATKRKRLDQYVSILRALKDPYWSKDKLAGDKSNKKK